MTMPLPIEAAECVLPSPDLEATLAFFTERLDFRIDSIFPADDPAVAVVSGHGLRIRLDRDAGGDSGVLRLLVPDPDAFAAGRRGLTAPNGTRIEFAAADPPLDLPPLRPALSVTHQGDDASWGLGRAGMRYRDLVPNRQGGRIIASHIRIPGTGPVPDYVHFHKIHFQMIYCRRGWVRVVYQDQGPPFVLEPGDCVLQPPEIRHRVLESGDDLEVIEIGCPAAHMTCVDHDLALPTPDPRPGRLFAGQRFVRHVAADAEWRPWRLAGWQARDTGIGAATGGIAGARVARPARSPSDLTYRHDAGFVFLFVLRGTVTLLADGHDPAPLAAGAAVTIPAGLGHALADCSGDLELLEVAMPAAFDTIESTSA